MHSRIIIWTMAMLMVSSVWGEQEPPTLYEYFASPNGENVTGLVAEIDGFKLNARPLRIISGAMHYFRIHPALWRDRLRKLRASGANTVETYVAWNLHEPRKDEWDFGTGENDNSVFLDIRTYIQMAKQEDLLVLLRPGPYICSEFEFGGMPSYLLRDPDMRVRTAYQPYLDRVKVYLDNLLPLVADLQFTRGGPIIGLQLENEYASFDQIELEYLEFLQQTYWDNGIDSLLFTSDGAWNGDKGSLPGVLKTANFGGDAETSFNDLLAFQPDKPVMCMEFWCGWFDHWFENHSTTTADGKGCGNSRSYSWPSVQGFCQYLHGTNFGFNAGANHIPEYAPDITSYDYDGPLSEAGDYTPKYYRIMEAFARYQIPVLKRPPLPLQSRKFAYPTLPVQTYLLYSDILEKAPASNKFQIQDRISMENFPINEGSGQSQGYVLYRKAVNIMGSDVTRFSAGRVRDFGLLIVDDELQPFPRDENGTVQYWLNSVQEYDLTLAEGEHTLDLLIENMGRVNFGALWSFDQHKGLAGNRTEVEYYHLNGEEIRDIDVVSLEFKSSWVKNLTGWRTNDGAVPLKAPVLVQSSFVIDGQPSDTFVDMSGWSKGIVFINGFNLGRYFNVGPQQTLYVPAPFLRFGENTITIFEQLQPHDEIKFSATPNLGPTAVRKFGQYGPLHLTQRGH
ncbi:Beta-galactosidase-1-like protein 2 [Folsomia candida]|uniref:Beta-galactosidase n=1 Tax=Folsomia candida TaxID=158441 RepID=A0A226EZM8_FOLCA|nr:Beta-galactosidase-1-like protein 2 [Folsomia candida]